MATETLNADSTKATKTKPFVYLTSVPEKSYTGDPAAFEIAKLPLKKRKLHYFTKSEIILDEKEDVGYPSTRMISIAEIQEKLSEPLPPVFETPTVKKGSSPSPEAYDYHSIVAEQFFPCARTEKYF